VATPVLRAVSAEVLVPGVPMLSASSTAAEVSPHTYVNVMDQYYPAGKVGRDRKYDAINRHIFEEKFAAALRVARDAGLYRIGVRIPVHHGCAGRQRSSFPMRSRAAPFSAGDGARESNPRKPILVTPNDAKVARRLHQNIRETARLARTAD